ncbi:hypothetical protein HID58_076507 [Brassica napus]|uniref:PPM-type phosphatase domain-containing protein n=1 Tax=Brassica napus TaxID=3708 RepID=A0ABQ7YMP6_BRANA|nr:hypothetical protein HID58_076507 [Brassica napus]
MANSFIILVELKNRDQSLQVLEDQRIDLLEDDRLRVISMLTYNIVDGTIYQAPQLCSVFAARVLIAKNQKKPSETKPPMRTATEALFSGFSSGTSALAALIFGRHLMVANAADGRAVLCRNGVNYVDHDDPITLALRSLRLNKLDNLTVVV